MSLSKESSLSANDFCYLRSFHWTDLRLSSILHDCSFLQTFFSSSKLIRSLNQMFSLCSCSFSISRAWSSPKVSSLKCLTFWRSSFLISFLTCLSISSLGIDSCSIWSCKDLVSFQCYSYISLTLISWFFSIFNLAFQTASLIFCF